VSPEPTRSERDTLALIAGIERASRRSRPFFLFGLLAVILGFVSVSVYLYQDREEERAQKAVLERQVGELTRTLNEARALGPQLDDSPAARERLRILLGEAIGTVESLPGDLGNAIAAVPDSTPDATRVQLNCARLRRAQGGNSANLPAPCQPPTDSKSGPGPERPSPVTARPGLHQRPHNSSAADRPSRRPETK
jgi:hypothetical protein